jgi:hypothetical protein
MQAYFADICISSPTLTHYSDSDFTIFALSLQCCVLSEEATNTNCIGFGFTQSVLELAIYRTRDEHTYKSYCMGSYGEHLHNLLESASKSRHSIA